MLNIAIVVAFAGFAAAQVPSLSSDCINALTGIAGNEEANACLGFNALLPLATASRNTSIVGPIDSWLSNVCAAAPCSNNTLAAIVSNVTTGCQAEISAEGTSPQTVASTITPLVQQYYPTVRKVACLRDGNTNCITQTLRNIENAVGPLTLANIMAMAMGGQGLQSLPANVTCTDCVKAAYNVIKTDVPSVVSDADPALQSQCGASFTDGSNPPGISQSAVDAAAVNANGNNDNGAVSITSGLAGVIAVAIVSAVFTLL